MAYAILPGPLAFSGTIFRIDTGTKQRVHTPPKGPVGNVGTSRRNLLSEQDRKDIESSGRDISGRPFSAKVLTRVYAQNLRVLKTVIDEQGAASWGAQYFSAKVEHLHQLLVEARSHHGSAIERLRVLLEPGNTKLDEKKLKKAMEDVLKAERQLQLRGQSSGAAMEVIAQATQAIRNHRRERVRNLLDQAKVPGSKVSEGQIAREMSGLLGIERQSQLLGVEDDDPGGNTTMALLAEGLEIGHKRRTDRLQALIEKAKKRGSKVTDAELRHAVGDVLAADRQLQLIGEGGEGDSNEDSALIAEAVRTGHERRKTRLQALMLNAKNPNSTVTDKQLRKALTDVVADQREMQLLGIEDPNEDIGGLLDQMADLREKRKKMRRRRPKRTLSNTPVMSPTDLFWRYGAGPFLR
jgi:hypothetical protein